MNDRKLRPAVAAVVVLVLGTSACTGGGGALPEGGGDPGQPATGESHPLGLKWAWDELGNRPALSAFVERHSGGSTFFEIEWCQIEPAPGQRDWSLLDEVVRSTRSLGYRLMLKLRVGSCWATGGQAGPPRGTKQKTPSAMPLDLDAYAAFVRDVVGRYDPQGVEEYAIENEANAANFWVGTPEDYGRLVEVGAAAVHQAAPSATVLDSGLASPVYGLALTQRLIEEGRDEEALRLYGSYYARRLEAGGLLPQPSTVEELRSFLDEPFVRQQLEFVSVTFDLFRAGVVDAYQLHHYEPWYELENVLIYVREHIGQDTPIEAWEVGFFWPGSSYDEEQQARETAKLLTTLLAAGVRRVVYLPLMAGQPPAGTSPPIDGEIWRGLYRPAGEPRPAASVFSRFVLATRSD